MRSGVSEETGCKGGEMVRTRRIGFLVLILMAALATRAEGELKFASLGDLQLEGGGTIKDCRVGYRTFGTLDAQLSNAILFPSWFAGTSKDLADLGFVGPGKLADTSRFFVVTVDALGNGISSSPSNSETQRGKAFPRFTIRDMVEVEHALLTRELKLPHVFAVVGISMGGMQAFQWALAYPGFAERVVAVEGSPKLASSDLLLWGAELGVIEGACPGDSGRQQAMKTMAAMHLLAAWTPGYLIAHTPPEALPAFLAENEKDILKSDPEDWASQLRAMMALDIFRPYGGSPWEAAKAVRAKALVVISRQDLMVNPGPAKAFALLAGAQTFEVTGDCGHLAFLCEETEVSSAVASFLSEGAGPSAASEQKGAP